MGKAIAEKNDRMEKKEGKLGKGSDQENEKKRANVRQRTGSIKNEEQTK